MSKKVLLSVLKNYVVNSTFHGLHFIAEDGRHWTERTPCILVMGRLFWLVCCLMSWFWSAVLVIASWQSFQNNAISFVVETTYLEAETNFPSISVCEDDNMYRIYKMGHKYFGRDHDCNLDEMLREIAYFKGSVYYMKEFCFYDIPCPIKDYKRMANNVRSPCKDIFKVCRWKNKTFDCCSHFLPVPTEWGTCYTLSARTEASGKPDYLHLKSSTRLGLGSLHIELLVPAKIYMHSDADIPYYNMERTNVISSRQGIEQLLGISVTDIENDPEVRQLSVTQRGCRFPEENYLTVSPVYSYSACVTECRKREQLRLCNCMSHLTPFADIPYYNMERTNVISSRQGIEQLLGISVTDIENDPEVRQLSVTQRGCRFPEENYLTVSPVYSYSACVTECRKREQLRLCNCMSHLTPFADEKNHCDMKGILCLTKHIEPMYELKSPWGVKEGLNCPCLPGCEEPEFEILETIRNPANEENKDIAIIEIYMQRFPSERYKRHVVRGRLNLLVSMGGAAGLFVGASLLSFAELIYFLTVRAYNTQMMKRRTVEADDSITVVTPCKPPSSHDIIAHPTEQIEL